MDNGTTDNTPEVENTPETGSMRTYAMIVYGLYALSGATYGTTALAGVIMAYLKRGEMAGTVYGSHMQYLIKTFWFGLLGTLLGSLTWVLFVGGLILLAASVWFIYRVVAGFVKLYDGKPVSPDGWF